MYPAWLGCGRVDPVSELALATVPRHPTLLQGGQECWVAEAVHNSPCQSAWGAVQLASSVLLQAAQTECQVDVSQMIGQSGYAGLAGFAMLQGLCLELRSEYDWCMI